MPESSLLLFRRVSTSLSLSLSLPLLLRLLFSLSLSLSLSLSPSLSLSLSQLHVTTRLLRIVRFDLRRVSATPSCSPRFLECTLSSILLKECVTRI